MFLVVDISKVLNIILPNKFVRGHMKVYVCTSESLAYVSRCGYFESSEHHPPEQVFERADEGICVYKRKFSACFLVLAFLDGRP